MHKPIMPRMDYCAWCECTEHYRLTIIEAAEELDHDSFPTDVFPEISKKELLKINEILKREMGFPLDRLGAHILRIKEKSERELAKRMRVSGER